MARRKLKQVVFGRCKVTIYKDSYAGEFVVQSSVDGKVIGGKASGGAFTNDMRDARGTAAHEIRWLKRKGLCR